MRFLPIGGYAPGNYMCRCAGCGCTAMNLDKRATSCVKCAFGEIPVFVFGSNLAGRHGKGAALFAKDHRGAIPGKGWGRMGNSYAIPTKDGALRQLPLADIAVQVGVFLHHARACPGESFQVTPIGCGLAGYLPRQIAAHFATAPDNCILPFEFKEFLQ